MYSLVSAPVLGFDLVRLPGGHRTAQVLAESLCLTEGDLDLLAVLDCDDNARERAWREVLDVTSGGPATGGGRQQRSFAGEPLAAEPLTAEHLTAEHLTGEPLTAEPSALAAAAAARLAAQPLGTVDALLRFIRHDVLDWTWQGAGEVTVQSEVGHAATAVLCDAAVSGYVPLTPEAARRLGAPWLSFRRRWLAQPLELGPQDAAIRRGLEVVRHLGLDRRAALLRAVDSQRDLDARMGETGAWSRAVHEASWAVHLTGRVREAAWVQLTAVQAVADSGLTARDCAEGAWNALSGALQAAMVADLLPNELLDTLLWPWERAFGPLV